MNVQVILVLTISFDDFSKDSSTISLARTNIFNPQITGINIYTNCGKLLTHVYYLHESTTIYNCDYLRLSPSTVQLNAARKMVVVKFSCPHPSHKRWGIYLYITLVVHTVKDLSS